MHGIYSIYCLVTGMMYIGSAVNLIGRCKTHLHRLNNISFWENSHLRNAWNKYGPEEFICEVLEIVEDKRNLIEREQWYFDQYIESGLWNTMIYNHCKNAGSCLGTRDSDETKLKKSLANKGRVFTEEHKFNLRRPLTEEHKEKLKGPKTPGHIEKLRKPKSEEHKQKTREAKLGSKHPNYDHSIDNNYIIYLLESGLSVSEISRIIDKGYPTTYYRIKCLKRDGLI